MRRGKIKYAGCLTVEPNCGKFNTVLPARQTVRAVAPSRGGYEATALDPSVKKTLEAVNTSLSSVESLKSSLERALENLANSAPGESAIDEANRVTVIYERLTKATLNLVKAVDEFTRLRSFLDGGPDSRPDLTSRGELELRVIVLKAVQQLGWKVVEQDGKAVSA